MAKLSLSNIMSTHDSALSRVINPKSTEFGYLGREQRFIMLKNKATEDNSKCQKKKLGNTILYYYRYHTCSIIKGLFWLGRTKVQQSAKGFMVDLIPPPL